MTYEISESLSINVVANRYLQYVHPDDVRKFLRKFRTHPPAGDEMVHTLQELGFGAFLRSQNIDVRHEWPVDGKTPDWVILGSENAVAGIIDVVNFHNDRRTETFANASLQRAGTVGFWKSPDSVTGRLYACLEDKCLAYRDIVQSRQIPYVVALYVTFMVHVDGTQLVEVLGDEDTGLFQRFPHVSGLMVRMDGGAGRICFVGNPLANVRIELPSGYL